MKIVARDYLQNNCGFNRIWQSFLKKKIFLIMISKIIEMLIMLIEIKIQNFKEMDGKKKV